MNLQVDCRGEAWCLPRVLLANRGYGSSLVRGVVWSTVAAFFAAAFLIPYRYAVVDATRFEAMAAMFVVATVFNALVAGARSKRLLPPVDRVAFTTAVALALCTIIGNLGIAFSLPGIGTGMTSVVLKAQVILTPVLAIWFLSERASWRLWIGALIAFAGVAFPQWVAADAAWNASGYLWALVAAGAFSAMQLITRRVITRIDPPSVNALRLAMALGVLQLFPEGRGVWRLEPSTWLFAATAAVLGPGLSRLSLMAALRYISPSLTALIALIGPVIAFGLGYAFFQEVPSALEVGGATIVLIGILFALLPRSGARQL